MDSHIASDSLLFLLRESELYIAVNGISFNAMSYRHNFHLKMANINYLTKLIVFTIQPHWPTLPRDVYSYY